MSCRTVAVQISAAVAGEEAASPTSAITLSLMSTSLASAGARSLQSGPSDNSGVAANGDCGLRRVRGSSDFGEIDELDGLARFRIDDEPFGSGESPGAAEAGGLAARPLDPVDDRARLGEEAGGLAPDLA